MQDFNVQISQNGAEQLITVSGYVNEYSKFPNITPTDKIIIDLEKVKGLNSVGTRSWCTWLKMMGPPAMVVLENCPVIFVKSFNQVKGSYPDNVKANSLIVPYYSDQTDERKDIVIKANEHFGTPNGLQLPTVHDSKGSEMEIDIIPDIYFAFLNRL